MSTLTKIEKSVDNMGVWVDKIDTVMDKADLERAGSFKQTGVFVSFIADDGDEDDKLVLKPIFDAQGVPLNLAIDTPAQGDFGDWTGAELLAEQDAGWTIASHSVTHPDLTSLTPEQLDTELSQSQEWLREAGLNADYMVYPFGANNADVREATRKYYKMGVMTGDGYLGVNSPPIHQFNVSRQVVENTAYATLQQRVTDAVALGGNQWVVYMIHSYEPGLNTTDLDNLITWIKGQSIPITNLDYAYENFANGVDVGDYQKDPWIAESTGGLAVGIGGEALMKPHANIARTEGVNSRDGNSDITAFLETGVSVIAFDAGDAGGTFPTTSGTLTTTQARSSADSGASAELWGHQEWKDYFSDSVYTRRYQSGSWSSWVEFGLASDDRLIVSSAPGAIVSTDPIGDFCDSGQRAYLVFTGAQGTAAGFGGAGTLVTDRIPSQFGDIGYEWQEWHPYEDPLSWKKRMWKANSTWTTFATYSGV